MHGQWSSAHVGNDTNQSTEEITMALNIENGKGLAFYNDLSLIHI